MVIGTYNTASEVKFTVLPFKEGYYWSKTLHKRVWMNDIKTIIWESNDLPVMTEMMTFPDMIEYIKKHPGTDKSNRNALVKIVSPRFPLKDRVGMERWNGTVFVDLDMANSPRIAALTPEQNAELYDTLDYALQSICPDTYAYIEHSNSGIGIHCIFYFNCEKTQANYDKFAQYIYEVFRYKIDEYIADFSHIFDETVCPHAVFDPVYKRPYQKLFMTTKDYRFYNVTGYCDNIDVKIEEKVVEDDLSRGSFDVRYITHKRKYDTDYYDRLYVLTALKKYVGDVDKCRKLWYDFCEDLTLYKNYTSRKFKNMFDQYWEKVDVKTGHISVLKKYGFKINETDINFYLSENEYMYDVIKDAVAFADDGINLLVAGTGVGKTEVWKKLNDIYEDPLERNMHKPILIIEPMNSIIESKYDPSRFRIVTGSKQIDGLNGYEMVITNYNHLLKYSADGVVLREDIVEFFKKFELVVVDESHIMMKDTFRSEVLIPFMMTLNKIDGVKIIIQTATPLFEKSVLNIKKTITIHKKEKSNTKVIYRQCGEKFNITDIICLVNYYITNKKKVYIYWKNGALQNMSMFKSIFKEQMIIYHKRNIGSADMKQINEEHRVNDTDVIISSVYFGVGNDLNDEIDDAAVIVIGNNIWQEDIQAKGRWRNAKNIEVCILLLPQDMNFVEASREHPFDWSDRLANVKWRLEMIYNDSLNRDKSVVIANQSFSIKSREYIDYLAKMQVANEYSSQICVKNEAFKKMGYDVREEIKPLLGNKEWIDELKQYKQNLKDVRNTNFRDFLKGIYNWDEINKDSSLERCARIIRHMQQRDLIKYCDLDKFIKSKIMRYGTFLRFYNNEKMSRSDYAELFSILWIKDRLKDRSALYKDICGIELAYKDYLMVCGYLIWTYYRNKEDNKDYIKGMYFDKYVQTANDMIQIEDELIERIFVSTTYSDEYNEFCKVFFDTDINMNEVHVARENLFEEIIKLDVDDEYTKSVMSLIVDYFKRTKNDKKSKAGKKSSPKKKCIITDNFSPCTLVKYKLQVDQEFESREALAEYTKTSLKTVSKWRKNGLVK